MTSKISNACGTIALLHSIYNVRTAMIGMQITHQGPFQSPLPVEPMSALQKFQEEGMGEWSASLGAAEERRLTLSTSQERRQRNEQSYLKKPISLRLLTKLPLQGVRARCPRIWTPTPTLLLLFRHRMLRTLKSVGSWNLTAGGAAQSISERARNYWR